MATIEDERTLRTTTACAIPLAVATTAILFRCWARFKIQRSVGLDDGTSCVV
jgi:hypothetical protein